MEHFMGKQSIEPLVVLKSSYTRSNFMCILEGRMCCFPFLPYLRVFWCLKNQNCWLFKRIRKLHNTGVDPATFVGLLKPWVMVVALEDSREEACLSATLEQITLSGYNTQQ